MKRSFSTVLPSLCCEIRSMENLLALSKLEFDQLKEWFSRPPKYTTLRINKLRKKFDSDIVKTFLRNIEELKSSDIPNMYFKGSDCLVIEQWPICGEIKQAGQEVIVDAACAAAVLRGAHVFAPGVMGLPTSIALHDRVDVYGDLEGKCKKGLKVPFEGPKLFVGTGYLRQTRKQLYDDTVNPSGIAVEIILPASKLPVINENLFPMGDVLLQNLPSIVCGWVVDARAGENILDMCAAPGNKTTHLAEMSGDKAKIIAIDKVESRVEKIKHNCRINSITCVQCYVYDSRKSFSEASEGILNGPPFPENSFDKILLDAPCSGLGQRPQLKCSMTPKMLESYKFIQRKLMDNAIKLLKIGGKLVYSTCTITNTENECMVAWVLEKYPNIKLVPAEPLLGGPGWTDCGLTDEQRAMVQRFGPERDSLREVEDIYRDTIGFFIASFTKTQ